MVNQIKNQAAKIGLQSDELQPASSNEVGIYLNHAASGLMDAKVVQTIFDHLRLEAEVGGYVAVEKVQAMLSSGKQSLATMLNTDPANIALTDCGTRAWHRAIESIDFKAGDKVLVSPMIWGGNYFTLLQMQRRLGLKLELMPTLPSGQINLQALPALLDSRVKLIEVCWAGSGWDWFAPAHEVVKIANAHGIPSLVDACQALGQIKIDLAQLGCTFLVASGRKWLRGPRGTGILYVDPEYAKTASPLGLDQHGAELDHRSDSLELKLAPDARPFSLGEASTALQLGLFKAAESALQLRQESVFSQLAELATYCRTRLAELPGFELAPSGESGIESMSDGVGASAIVTFCHPLACASKVKEYLRKNGVEVNVHPASFMPLHKPTLNRGDSVRISPHIMNTRAEIDRLVDLLLALR